MNFKYLKMEAECTRLCSSLQLSHGFLQCHDFLQRPRWGWPLWHWLVGEGQGGRKLQEGRNTARTWNTRPVRASSYSKDYNQPERRLGGTETNAHTPFRLISKDNSLECDSLLARMNMTTWSCVCSEMSLPLMSTTRSPSMSLGSHRPACEEARVI